MKEEFAPIIKEFQQEFDNLNSQEKMRVEDLLTILTEMGLGDEIKRCGLVYHLITLGQIKQDDLKETNLDLWKQIQTLIKIDQVNYSKQDEEAENIRKMFFGITKDIRIVMIKIALTIVKYRHVDEMTPDEVNTLVRSIFDLYAPLCARLSLTTFKTELENGAFRLSQPEKYLEIQKIVNRRVDKRRPIVEELQNLVRGCLKDLNITGRVYGRNKHLYSVYKKLQDHPIEQIYDLIAVRAILPTTADCYALLGRLQAEVEPLPKRFKDYIASPKENGYQSLHITVKFKNCPVEIQIRTEEMHKYAEYGVAAHWIYKEKRAKQDSLDLKLSWLRQMMENENVSIEELSSSLDQDIFNDDIYVQTPMGKVIYLPSGATTLDFAYAIHSEVGNKCVGAKVNGKMVPTNSVLNNGDTVEIVTNPNSKGPSRDWLKICKTAEAKKKINEFFKRNMKEENIHLGRTMLENCLKEKGYVPNKMLTQEILVDALNYYNLTFEELLANIGTNAIRVKAVANKLEATHRRISKQEIAVVEQTNNVTFIAPTEKQVQVKGLNNILIGFAGCCHPMYGDPIVGFVSTGRGIIIHRTVCPNVACFDEGRLIEAEWKPLEKVAKKK
ncbi:MAG: TGS domain-containing protein [Clostridia bacterium]|nr:TGS domain-containing protein [Clostridia bacterium]